LPLERKARRSERDVCRARLLRAVREVIVVKDTQQMRTCVTTRDESAKYARISMMMRARLQIRAAMAAQRI